MITTESVQGPLALVPNGVVWPFGGEVFYVATTTQMAAMGKAARGIKDRLFPTVNDALSACTSNHGDKIEIFENYTETIATADKWSNLGTKTGVTIHGNGTKRNRPAFTWSASGSTMLMDAAGFKIQNCQMFMAGDPALTAALTVAAPITITAEGCEISNCYINWGVDADQIVAIGITTSALADYFTFNNNVCWAPALAVPTTTFLRLVGTDHLEMVGTTISGPGSTVAIGPVQQLTTGALDCKIVGSIFQSTLASSTHSFTALAGSTGTVHQCSFGVLAAGNGLTTGSGLQVTDSWTAVAGAAGVATTG